MAFETCSNRSSTSSRQSKFNSESNELPYQKCDGQSAREASVVRSAYDGRANGSNGIKVPSNYGGNLNQGGDSDSEDDVPLSTSVKSRPSDYSTKVNQSSNLASRLSIPVKKEDSDDEKPLSSRRKRDVTGATSSRKCISDSEDEKPLARMTQQNGLALANKSPVVINKRPSSDSNLSAQSSIKKPKLSDASNNNCRKAPVKAEPQNKECNGHIPILQKIKSSVDKKVDKGVSSSIKKVDEKSKKIQKKSKYDEKPLSCKLKREKTGASSSKCSDSDNENTYVPSSSGGQKWTSLVHNGVIFPPFYQPHGVKILFKKKPVHLTPEQEEVATMYAVMLDTDYMNNAKFKDNFFKSWREILGKDHVIQNLEDCDFTPIYEWHQAEKERKKQMSSEEKKSIKEEKMKQEEKYMWAIVDGVKEKVGNFRVEPPGLFRGRGDHGQIGKLKRRILPSDITINIGKGAPIPECPVPGERWKEIKHDNTVTWLAFWNDPIKSKLSKYVFLAASSTLKGQSDKEKYEKARKLTDYIDKIRDAYTKNFTAKDATKRQIAVATYLIDKLALRAGNEKDDDEADTVGCCTLKVQNVEPVPPNILKFDFLGKDSIRYQNVVEVELPVFEAIQKFRKGKKGGDELFDMLDTSKLNAHLKELMPGLTAKVFRTYNASRTLDDLLTAQTKGEDVAENTIIYQHANKEVAIICNHQRTVTKSHGQQMERLDEKIKELNNVLEELKVDLDRAKKGKPPLKDADGKTKRNLAPEAIEKKIAQTHARIEKMERDKETKEDLKTVALGTSKTNYLDPRITVAWCKRHEVPIEKVFNKSLLAKFCWAMDVDPCFRF